MQFVQYWVRKCPDGFFAWSAPNHYLNQCWHTPFGTNLNEIIKKKNTFEKFFCKMFALCLRLNMSMCFDWQVVGMACLACGMIAVGSCNGDVTSTILQTLMEKSETELKDTYARFLALGLALTYLGKQDMVETTLAALEVIPEPYKSMASTLAEICAYAGKCEVDVNPHCSKFLWENLKMYVHFTSYLDTETSQVVETHSQWRQGYLHYAQSSNMPADVMVTQGTWYWI